MNTTRFALTALLAVACAAPSQAAIIDDFNSGVLLADFLFDDVSGTQIPDTLNSANPALPFDSDSDNDPVVTNGTGQLDASGKNNTSLGTNYVDLPTIETGRVIALYDVAWEFNESVYDSSQDEEFRLTLITNDPRSTFITAQTYFQRTSATEVTLFADAAGVGALDSPDVLLGSSGRVLTLLDANLDEDTLEVYYSFDSGATFLSSGAGVIESSRGVESLRLAINEDFSADSLLIDRVAVSWIVPEPTGVLLALLGVMPLARRRR